MSKNDSALSPKRKGSIVGRVVAVLFAWSVLAAGVWAALNMQTIIDQITVLQFKPTVAVQSLVSESGMSQRGEFLYMASQPQLDDRNDFNNNCTTREKQSIVLGCYKSGRIFVFNVTDERISGVKIVTAAHEMLHAAYERLVSSDRTNVDKLLEAQLAKTTEQDILDLVKVYDKTEPGERWNELHSLFATEKADLSSELEDYYKTYFSDRSKVVGAYEKYHKVFTDLELQARDLQSSLADKKSTIEAKTTEYQTAADSLNSDIEAFNQKAATTNAFSSQSQFYSERSGLIARQTALNNLANEINSLVNEYNTIVKELNAIGVEINELNQNLNSQSETIGS